MCGIKCKIKKITKISFSKIKTINCLKRIMAWDKIKKRKDKEYFRKLVISVTESIKKDVR